MPFTELAEWTEGVQQPVRATFIKRAIVLDHQPSTRPAKHCPKNEPHHYADFHARRAQRDPGTLYEQCNVLGPLETVTGVKTMQNPHEIKALVVESFGVVIRSALSEFTAICEDEGDLKSFKKYGEAYHLDSVNDNDLRAFAAQLSDLREYITRIHEHKIVALLSATVVHLETIPIPIRSDDERLQCEAMLFASRMSSLYDSICGVQIESVNRQIRKLMTTMDSGDFFCLGTGLITRSIYEVLIFYSDTYKGGRELLMHLTLLHAKNLNRALLFLCLQLEDEVHILRRMRSSAKTESGFMQTIPLDMTR